MDVAPVSKLTFWLSVCSGTCSLANRKTLNRRAALLGNRQRLASAEVLPRQAVRVPRCEAAGGPFPAAPLAELPQEGSLRHPERRRPWHRSGRAQGAILTHNSTATPAVADPSERTAMLCQPYLMRRDSLGVMDACPERDGPRARRRSGNVRQLALWWTVGSASCSAALEAVLTRSACSRRRNRSDSAPEPRAGRRRGSVRVRRRRTPA